MCVCVDVGRHVFISFCKQMGPYYMCLFKMCFFSDMNGNRRGQENKKNGAIQSWGEKIKGGDSDRQ